MEQAILSLAPHAAAFAAPIPEDDAARLATLHSYAILDTLPEQGYEDVTALATLICDAPYATITFVDRDRQWFKSEAGFGTNETGRSEGFCACAVLQPEPMIVEDALLDPRFAANPFVLDGPCIRFYAGAPLIAPNGHVLGTVCVFDNKPRRLDGKQVAGLERLARQVMLLLDARLRFAEREKAYAALMQSEKIAAVGRLAASMAHELNNPLESLTNLLYLAKRQAEVPDVKDWLEQADLELRRIADIARQTLRFHKQASFPQSITCDRLFSSVINLYEARFRNSGVRVESRKRANDPVRCFEGDVRQVLSHLVSNAIDAMPRGGRLLIRSRHTTHWQSGRRGIKLTIADTGTGMDQQTRLKCFEAFHTTKGINGLGLGLWISKEILDRHNGTIALRSKESQGTVVSLFLPFS